MFWLSWEVLVRDLKASAVCLCARLGGDLICVRSNFIKSEGKPQMTRPEPASLLKDFISAVLSSSVFLNTFSREMV